MSAAYTAGQTLDADDLSNPTASYWYSQTVLFTAGGSFLKASYPGLRGIRVKVQAAGGGSGGCATNAAGNVSVAGSGGGGEYGERWILAAALGASETVTVGAGGTAGSAGANAGGTGGTSSLGTLITCIGGGAGAGGGTGTSVAVSSGGGGGSGGTGGDFYIQGGDGAQGFRLSASQLIPAQGGDAILASVKRPGSSNTGSAGLAGHSYGGGAAGSFLYASQTQVAGAAGAPGIVIVEVYM